MIKTIGTGSYSKVKLAEHIESKVQYAIKVINKKILGKRKKGLPFRDERGNLVIPTYLQDALREIAILKKIDHDNIVTLYEILHYDEENESKIYLVMEYMKYGSIMIYEYESDAYKINHIFSNANIGKYDYTEDEIRLFLRDVVSALDYCIYLIKKYILIILSIEILNLTTSY